MSAAGEILLAGEAILVATHSMENVFFNSVTYAAFVITSAQGTDLTLGGFTGESLHQLAIPRASIADAAIPTEGTAATFRTAGYIIDRVERDDAEAQIVITLVPDSSQRRK